MLSFELQPRMDDKISSSFLTECFRFYYDKRSELKYKWLTNSEITAAFTHFLGSEEMMSRSIWIQRHNFECMPPQ